MTKETKQEHVCARCGEQSSRMRFVLELNAVWCAACVIKEKVDKIDGQGGYTFWKKKEKS